MCAGSFYLFLFKYTLSHKLKVVYFVKMEVPITKKESENKVLRILMPKHLLFICSTERVLSL